MTPGRAYIKHILFVWCHIPMWMPLSPDHQHSSFTHSQSSVLAARPWCPTVPEEEHHWVKCRICVQKEGEVSYSKIPLGHAEVQIRHRAKMSPHWVCTSTTAVHSRGCLAPQCPCEKPSDSHGRLSPEPPEAGPEACTGQRGCRALGRKMQSNCKTAFFHPFNLSLQLFLAHATFLMCSSVLGREQDVLSCCAREGTRKGPAWAAQIGKCRAVAPATCLWVWLRYWHSVALWEKCYCTPWCWGAGLHTAACL